jgi:hypothetical protein
LGKEWPEPVLELELAWTEPDQGTADRTGSGSGRRRSSLLLGEIEVVEAVVNTEAVETAVAVDNVGAETGAGAETAVVATAGRVIHSRSHS